MSADLLGAIVAAAFVLATLGIVLVAHDGARARAATNGATPLYEAENGPLIAQALGLRATPERIERDTTGTVAIIALRQGPAPALVLQEDALVFAATALVVAEVLQVNATRGIFRYPDRDLAIPLTQALRDVALRHLNEIRALEELGPILTRQDPAVCRGCVYRSMCAIGRANAHASYVTRG